LEEVAVRTAGNLVSGSLKAKREKPITDRIFATALKFDAVKNTIFQKAKAKVMKQTNGLYPAPLKVNQVNHPKKRF
jgi:enoyl-CoA hydratase/long-chain 3-hydroxyacyl-CoA dehydrogenase